MAISIGGRGRAPRAAGGFDLPDALAAEFVFRAKFLQRPPYRPVDDHVAFLRIQALHQLDDAIPVEPVEFLVTAEDFPGFAGSVVVGFKSIAAQVIDGIDPVAKGIDPVPLDSAVLHVHGARLV